MEVSLCRYAGERMSGLSDQMAVAIVIFGALGVMALVAWLDDRKNRILDAHWRAGYEQGMKVVKRHVR